MISNSTTPNILSINYPNKWAIRAFQYGLFISIFGFSASSGPSSEGSIFRQSFWVMLVLIAVGSIYVSVFSAQRVKLFLGKWPLWAFILFALISTYWSDAPLITFKRALLLCMVGLICGAAFGNLHNKRVNFSNVVGAPILLLLYLSILITVVAPNYAFTDLGWRGISSHKNEIGQAAAISLILAFYGDAHPMIKGKMKWVIILMSFIGLMLSKSTTSLLGFVIAVCVIGLISLPAIGKRIGSWNIPLFIIVSALLVALHISFISGLLPSLDTLYSMIFHGLGKSETFTGRTALWDLVMAESARHNILIGGGYGGFWDVSYSRIQYIIKMVGFQPIQAHNGYLEVFNDLGYVGLLILALVVSSYAIAILSMLAYKPVLHDLRLHFALLVFFLVTNLTESVLLRGTQFLNIIFIASFIYVTAEHRRRQLLNKSGINSAEDNNASI